MLILIICGLVAISCFVFGLIAHHKKESDYDFPIIVGVFISIGLIFTVIHSVSENTAENAQKIRDDINIRMYSYERAYQQLTRFDQDPDAVKEYNKDVEGFRNMIKEQKRKLKNPWINCFTCYVYKEFDETELKTIGFMVHTSK